MTQRTVLVVEDDVVTLVSASSAFRDQGLSVLEADSADAALAVLLTDGADVALVFSDIETPGVLDGVSLAEAVADRWPAITVVLTSGLVRPDFPRFVAKPYDLDRVAPMIASLAQARPAD